MAGLLFVLQVQLRSAGRKRCAGVEVLPLSEQLAAIAARRGPEFLLFGKMSGRRSSSLARVKPAFAGLHALDL